MSMASFRVLSLLAIASVVFSQNTDALSAQIKIGSSQSSGISTSHQMLLEMQQSNAPAIGGGSMQLLRFTDKNISFSPLEGLDRLFNWQPKEGEVMTNRTLSDGVERFKLMQRQQIVSDSQMFAAINRINRKN